MPVVEKLAYNTTLVIVQTSDLGGHFECSLVCMYLYMNCSLGLMSSRNFSLLLGSTLSLGRVQLDKKAETQAIKWQENSHTLLLS